jgi:hypothetical protein
MILIFKLHISIVSTHKHAHTRSLARCGVTMDAISIQLGIEKGQEP